ncbi:conserved hypothetical protein [Mucor ambiguus]|uniref:Uncharacterized protein n=1 Tax=Mucor ambiguus TaxID=91626 RepID=A0A0C9MFH3_9FUNG|nr:conserved hypothetical protein [Mucor ambiguus]
MSNTTVSSSDANVMLDLGLVNPDGMEVASELTSLACITVLALALGAKTYGEKLKSLNYGRVLVIMLYTLSWAFATTSIIVVSTNNSTYILRLIERVHLVTAVKTTRLKTAQYKFHIILLCPYIIIFVLMLSFRNIYLEGDGTCTIGLQDIASIPLLIFNLYLTWLFMKPLTNIGRNTRQDWKVTRLYKLARRTLVASVVCLSVSFINVLFVVLSHGHQRGLVCLTMCTVDVTVTTSGTSSSGNNRTKTHNDEHMTADMTFDGDNHEKSMKFDIQMVQPHILDDDDDSITSVQASSTSKKPINHYYN